MSMYFLYVKSRIMLLEAQTEELLWFV